MEYSMSCQYIETPPTYQEFLDCHLISNKPVVIGPALISSWKSVELWVQSRQGSQINWEYLTQQYGHLPVTAADCATREFSDQKRETMLFREVVAFWQSGRGENLYVKDWHLARAIISQPRLGSDGIQDTKLARDFYSTPDIFCDDWMNAYYSACTDDDFRFVYVGAKGTFTPLHRDVYTSYSWSTNVCGRKRWWLFPPEQTKYLLRRGREEHLETIFDVRAVNPQEFPEFVHANPIVVDQNEGETIFVPSGWYHQVENLSACVSINHNWCNSVNLPSLYESMCAKVVEVEHALEDVREMLSHNGETNSESRKDDQWRREWVHIVQDLVEKDAGWNWSTFWKMVLYALDSRSTNSPILINETPSLWEPAPRHLTPPWHFIEPRVRACYRDFLNRDQREVDLVDGLGETLHAIGACLDGSKEDGRN